MFAQMSNSSFFGIKRSERIGFQEIVRNIYFQMKNGQMKPTTKSNYIVLIVHWVSQYTVLQEKVFIYVFVSLYCNYYIKEYQPPFLLSSWFHILNGNFKQNKVLLIHAKGNKYIMLSMQDKNDTFNVVNISNMKFKRMFNIKLTSKTQNQYCFLNRTKLEIK